MGYFNSALSDETVRNQTYNVMYFEGAIIICIALFTIIAMKEKPEHPPSKLALTKVEDMTLGMWKDVGLLLKNCNFMALLLVYSVLYSVINSLMDAISPIFHPYYDSESLISLLGVIQILTSVITSILAGCYLDKSRKYLLTLRTTIIASTVVTTLMIFLIPIGNVPIVITIIAVFGLVGGPILPVGFDFSIQLTHPIQPALVNGMLQMFEQLCEFLLSTSLVALAARDPQYALAFVAMLCLMAAIVSLFIKEELRVDWAES
jgi:MFS family permease